MSAIRSVLAATAAVALLGGCAVSQPHLNPEFGLEVRESLAAQIADPDARYAGSPDPGSSGSRVGLAQERYRTGKVIEPQPANTTIFTTLGVGQGR